MTNLVCVRCSSEVSRKTRENRGSWTHILPDRYSLDAIWIVFESCVSMTFMQLELERVIGLTTTTAAGLACNGEELAYLAGCVVVVYNVRTNCQTHFLVAPRGPKAFACVAYSGQGGKFVAAGEVWMCPSDVIVSLNFMWVMMKRKLYGMVCIHFFGLPTLHCRFKLSFVDL